MRIKNKIIDALSRFPFIQKIFRGKGAILMLHRIAPLDETKLPANENMKVSPGFLEDFIFSSKALGYRFISLDELHEGLVAGNLKDKFLCVTIDDGYKDNFTHGYPIFKKHDVPFCVYFCTSFAEKSHDMWWFGLEDRLLASKTIVFEGEEKDVSTLEKKQETFLKLREHVIKNGGDKASVQKILNDDLKISYNPSDYDDHAMSWEDVVQMLRSGLATVGNHTHSHPVFNNLTHQEIIADVLEANALFQKRLGFTPRHFAYPFGGRAEVEARYFDVPVETGFATAVTTRNGTIYPAHANFLNALPRVFLSENLSLSHAFRIRKSLIVTH